MRSGELLSHLASPGLPGLTRYDLAHTPAHRLDLLRRLTQVTQQCAEGFDVVLKHPPDPHLLDETPGLGATHGDDGQLVGEVTRAAHGTPVRPCLKYNMLDFTPQEITAAIRQMSEEVRA